MARQAVTPLADFVKTRGFFQVAMTQITLDQLRSNLALNLKSIRMAK